MPHPVRIFAASFLLVLSVMLGTVARPAEAAEVSRPVIFAQTTTCDVSIFDPGGSVSCMLGWLKDQLAAALSSLGNLLSNVINVMSNALSTALNTLGSAVSNMSSTLSTLLGNVIDTLWGVGQGIVDGIGTFLGTIHDDFMSWYQAISDGVSAIPDAIANWIGQVVQWLSDVWDTLTGIPQAVWNVFSDGLQWLFVPQQSTIDVFKDGVNDMLDHSPVGVLLAAVAVPGAAIGALAASAGSACPPGSATVAGTTFSLCNAITSAASLGDWGGVKAIITALLIGSVVFGVWNRLSEMSEH